METLKIILIASAALLIYLLLKTGTWKRMPIISTIFSIALFLGAVAIAIVLGSVLIFVILAVIAIFLVIFIILRIFGRAKLFRLSKGSFRISSEEIRKANKSSEQSEAARAERSAASNESEKGWLRTPVSKKPKVKVIK
ncbi:MAG: hypothetical protein QME12_00725 [Nanoarchaeota archaeon]|nr:hypothetical protein [Nanoarchaeota archaeon]